jgi:hypothetical protein
VRQRKQDVGHDRILYNRRNQGLVSSVEIPHSDKTKRPVHPVRSVRPVPSVAPRSSDPSVLPVRLLRPVPSALSVPSVPSRPSVPSVRPVRHFIAVIIILISFKLRLNWTNTVCRCGARSVSSCRVASRLVPSCLGSSRLDSARLDSTRLYVLDSTRVDSTRLSSTHPVWGTYVVLQLGCVYGVLTFFAYIGSSRNTNHHLTIRLATELGATHYFLCGGSSAASRFPGPAA